MGKGLEHNERSRISLAEAKKARNIVWTVKTLKWSVPVLAYAAVWIFAPWQVGAIVSGVIVLVGLMYATIERGDDIADWYRDQRRNWNYAKQNGVRDE